MGEQPTFKTRAFAFCLCSTADSDEFVLNKGCAGPGRALWRAAGRSHWAVTLGPVLGKASCSGFERLWLLSLEVLTPFVCALYMKADGTGTCAGGLAKQSATSQPFLPSQRGSRVSVLPTSCPAPASSPLLSITATLCWVLAGDACVLLPERGRRQGRDRACPFSVLRLVVAMPTVGWQCCSVFDRRFSLGLSFTPTPGPEHVPAQKLQIFGVACLWRVGVPVCGEGRWISSPQPGCHVFTLH